MIESSALQHDPVMLPGRPFGRLAWSIAGYALLLSLMLITPLFVFVPAAIFHCGLRNGRMATLVSVVAAAIVAWVVAVQTAHAPGISVADTMMGYAYVIALVVSVAIPSILVQARVERGEPFGRVLLISILLSMAGLAATEVGMRVAAGFSPGREQVVRVQQMAAQFIDAYQKGGAPRDVVDALRVSSKLAVLCAPGFLVAEIAIVFVLSLVMFGRLRTWREFADHVAAVSSPAPAAVGDDEDEGAEAEAIRVTPKRPMPSAAAMVYRFRNLSLPDWLLFAFVFGGIAPLAGGMLQSITANVLAVTVFLYLLQGLAIFRSLLVAVGAGPLGALFAWGMVVFMMPIAMLLLSIAGLFDSFFDFRKFKRKDHSDESHPH